SRRRWVREIQAPHPNGRQKKCRRRPFRRRTSWSILESRSSYRESLIDGSYGHSARLSLCRYFGPAARARFVTSLNGLSKIGVSDGLRHRWGGRAAVLNDGRRQLLCEKTSKTRMLPAV